METRQATMSEMSKQLEEMRSLQSKQTEDHTRIAAELRAELAGEMSELKAMMVKFLTHTSPAPSNSPDDSAPVSATITASPSTSRQPEPPDRRLPDQSNTKRTSADSDHTPSLPNGLSSRLTKVGFPIFNGCLLREWIYRCEQFFSLDNTSPEMKVRLASLHMEGKALQWHHNYISNRYDVYPLWPEYVGAISARFGELYDDPLSELVSLKQGSDPVEIYLEKFE